MKIGDRARSKTNQFTGLITGDEQREGVVTRVCITAESAEPGVRAPHMWFDAADVELAGDAKDPDDDKKAAELTGSDAT